MLVDIMISQMRIKLLYQVLTSFSDILNPTDIDVLLGIRRNYNLCFRSLFENKKLLWRLEFTVFYIEGLIFTSGLAHNG